MTSFRALALAGSLLLGCGGTTPTPTPTPAPAPSALLSQDEMVGLCERLHREVVSCTREFVGLNIDLRIKYMPEFAERMADPEFRKAVEAEGAKETIDDAASAHERCVEFAKPAWGQPQPRTDLAALDGCYAQVACDAKMACLRPLIEPRFAYRAQHPSAEAH